MRGFSVLFIRLGIIAICIALPLTVTAYVYYFIDPALVFKSYIFHAVAVAFAVVWGAFISYVSYRCYVNKREVFLRYLTLALLGQSMLYVMHGVLTPTADWKPILFILYGPVSRMIMAAFMLAAMLNFKKGTIDNFERQHWILWLCGFVILIPVVAAIALSPIGTNYYLRAGMEVVAICLYLIAIGIYLCRRINTPLMFLYLISIIFFIQSSATFIIVQQPWNHLFWIAHVFFAGGFFIITCGLLRAFNTSTSFSEVFTEDQLVNKVADQMAELQLAANVFSHAREGIAITDAAQTIIDVNDTFAEISGYSREEVIGQNTGILKSDRHSPEFYASIWKSINTIDYWTGEVWSKRKNGEVYPVSLTISAVKDSAGKVSNYVELFSDITLMKDHQGELTRMAHYDVLTNLPNRVLLLDRLSHAMVQCQRRKQSLAVAFMDLDGFKAVNDTHGHNVGDELLVALSQRMQEALREGDTLARIGGDEFIAVMVDLEKIEDSEPVLERLLKAASDPVTLGDTIIQVSASIGVTLYPQNDVDADQLMRHADQAMYVAKLAGKNRYHLFDTAQDNAIKTQRQSIGDVRIAMGRREFVLHYQPKVNMRTSEVIGLEALIRWQHPDRGTVPPLEFLPAIEGHPISLELGEWVIDTALTQISQWQSKGVDLPISVNISAYQLQQANFTARLSALLATRPEVPPHCLELEILETNALNDISQVSATMAACQELGVRFALDDFGTGYSSLTYLRRLPAYLIKIDQSFVRDMLEDVDDLAIVEGVVGLAKAFQREVIAEGVETIAHGVALLQLGCELAQGYGIARPMPAGDIPEWVSNWKADKSWRTVDCQ